MNNPLAEFGLTVESVRKAAGMEIKEEHVEAGIGYSLEEAGKLKRQDIGAGARKKRREGRKKARGHRAANKRASQMWRKSAAGRKYKKKIKKVLKNLGGRKKAGYRITTREELSRFITTVQKIVEGVWNTMIESGHDNEEHVRSFLDDLDDFMSSISDYNGSDLDEDFENEIAMTIDNMSFIIDRFEDEFFEAWGEKIDELTNEQIESIGDDDEFDDDDDDEFDDDDDEFDEDDEFDVAELGEQNVRKFSMTTEQAMTFDMGYGLGLLDSEVIGEKDDRFVMTTDLEMLSPNVATACQQLPGEAGKFDFSTGSFTPAPYIDPVND